MSNKKTSPQKSRTTRNQFHRVRNDHATELAEDYVEAIAQISAASGLCRAADLARHFAVSSVTVNRTVARLVRDGWVECEPYGPVRLSSRGKSLASACRSRHEVVVHFLMSLGVSKEIAEQDAEGIEHHVSPETLKAMAHPCDCRLSTHKEGDAAK